MIILNNFLNIEHNKELPSSLQTTGEVNLLDFNLLIISLDNITDNELFLFNDGELSFGVIGDNNGSVLLASQYKSLLTNLLLTFTVYLEHDKLDLSLLPVLKEGKQRLLMKIVVVNKDTNKVISIRASTLSPQTQADLCQLIERQIQHGSISKHVEHWESQPIEDVVKSMNMRLCG